MKLTWWRLFLFLGLFVSASIPAASSDQIDSKVCVEDDLSRQVCACRPVKRIISLAPSLTETVFDLGAGSLLVGRTERCNEPPDATTVPIVGAYLNPDLERIISLSPDLVLCPEAGMRKEIVYRLTELGIPTFVDGCTSLDGIVNTVTRLGKLLGRESEANSVLVEFQRRRNAIKERVGSAEKPLIVFAVGIKPLVIAGGKSFISSLIREAGGVGIGEDALLPYPKYNMEEVARRDPDMIIVLNKECREDECLNAWKAHGMLKAVRNGHVYQIDADLIARPSPRIMDALEQLAAILHPDLSKSSAYSGARALK